MFLAENLSGHSVFLASQRALTAVDFWYQRVNAPISTLAFYFLKNTLKYLPSV